MNFPWAKDRNLFEHELESKFKNTRLDSQARRLGLLLEQQLQTELGIQSQQRLPAQQKRRTSQSHDSVRNETYFCIFILVS